jgi:hypothetical protein
MASLMIKKIATPRPKMIAAELVETNKVITFSTEMSRTKLHHTIQIKVLVHFSIFKEISDKVLKQFLPM